MLRSRGCCARRRPTPSRLETPPRAKLAFFFSALRQGIEQELVQLRIDGPTVKQSATDEACARQLDLLIDNHPLAGSPRHAKFRGWAFGVARGPILQGLLSLLCFDLPRARRR